MGGIREDGGSIEGSSSSDSTTGGGEAFLGDGFGVVEEGLSP